MAYETILYEQKGRTAVITLNRPQSLNAISAKLGWELADALETATSDADIWAIVLTGAGDRAFCAGADLKEMASGQRDLAKESQGSNKGLAALTQSFIPKPIIAAVNGLAFGGGSEIALACDLIVASERASFALPEVKRGIVAGAGGVLRLPRQIPMKIALQMIFTGEPISAQEAERWGLVNRVVPHEELMTAALALADQICQNAPVAVRSSKEIVYRGLDVPLGYAVTAWDINSQAMGQVLASEDAKEGPLAFAEKRAPVWKGR